VLPWAVTGVTAAALVGAVMMWSPWRALPAPPVLRLITELGADAPLSIVAGAAAVISPDGRMIAFTAVGPDGAQLFLRRLGQLNATPLPGTAGAFGPFFSPDGQSLGFFNASRLMRISTGGGGASTVCPAGAGRGGTWAPDDTIYFQPTTNGVLMRVPASGGTPAPVAAFGEGEATQRWPQMLPGGRALIYTGNSQGTGWEDARVMLQPLPSGTPKVLVSGGYHGRYVAGRTGDHIIYVRQGTIFAVPFDLATLQVSGRPVSVLDGVVASNNNGGAQFSVSDDGTMVYAAGKGGGSTRAMFWMDSSGTMTTLRAEETNWLEPKFSPGGHRIAFAITDGGQLDLWVYDWARDTPTKFTFDSSNDRYPVWTPDEQRLVFASDRAKRGTNNLYWQRADAGGSVQRLTDSPNMQTPFSFDPTGKYLAYTEQTGGSSSDLMILPLEGDETKGWTTGKPYVFLSTPATETAPMFSPDGRWIAYTSDESTLLQTYVRPFRGAGGKQLVSASGVGVSPVWSPTRSELFFLDPVASSIMVVPYRAAADSFRADKPRVWSPGKYGQEGTSRVYDVHPDGKRVVIGKPPEEATLKRNTIVLVQHFADEIARAVSGAK
jgi:serine/threonine-protein kinase